MEIQRTPKISWRGAVTSVQPRIRLLRSFDEASHSYQGFVVGICGDLGEEQRDFRVALGQASYASLAIRVGDMLSGEGLPVADRNLETADLYKLSKLTLSGPRGAEKTDGAPWQGVAPSLLVYRERRCRRLSERTYETSCTTCLWGCRMPVEIIIDQWTPDRRKYRFETFCYGPISCPIYKAGPKRRVQGRKPGMTWEEPDWVDEEVAASRKDDDP